MHSDEELIADRNILVVAQALIDIIHIFCTFMDVRMITYENSAEI